MKSSKHRDAQKYELQPRVHTLLTASSLSWKSPGGQGHFPLICLQEIDKYWKWMVPRKTSEFEKFVTGLIQ